MQNLQMMISKVREDDPSVNMVTGSGADMGVDKAEGKKPVADAWVRKAREKSNGFNMQREKETFMEAKNSFMDLGSLTSKTQMQLVP